MMKLSLALAITIAATVPGITLAQSASMPGMDKTSTIAPATRAYMDAMMKMHDAMKSMTPTNDPSKDFVIMMKPHHQAAVDMARAYLVYGHDPKLRKMSEDIINSQTEEIKDMDSWLANHKN